MVANRIVKANEKIEETETSISLCQMEEFAPKSPRIEGIAIVIREKPFTLMNPNKTVNRAKYMGSLTNANLDRARYYFNQKDWERTIAACRDALKIFPNLAEAYKIWGNTLQKQVKISEAIGCYAKALEIQPDMPEIYVNLGSIYAQKKQWQKAINYFQQAIDFNPDFDGAYRNLARVWTELGDLEKATDATYRAYCLAPQKATAAEHYLLGRQLLSQQRLDEALECYRQAITQKPDWLEVYEHLANLLEKLGQWEESVSYRRQIVILQKGRGQTSLAAQRSPAIVASKPHPKPNVDVIQLYLEQAQQDPDSAEIHAILGSLFEQRQKWKEAIVYYRKSLQLDSQQHQIYDKITQILLKVGREDIAADCWYRALTLKGKAAEPTEYLRLGNLQQKLNQIDAASLSYRRALRLQPTLAEAYDRLAEICLQQGKIEAAIEIYQTALKYNPQDDRIYSNLGKILASGNNWQAAIACYQQALTIDPNLWQVYHELGDAFSQQKSWQDAATAYRRAIDLKPDFFWSYNNLGYALLYLQAPTEAIEVLQKALQLKQDFHWTYDNLGAAYISLQRWNEAAAAYNRVLELQPQSTQAAERLDYILQQKAAADSNLAFDLYLEAIERDPNDLDNYRQALEIYGDLPQDATLRVSHAELYLGLADACIHRHEWTEALANYRRSLALNPDNLAIKAKIDAVIAVLKGLGLFVETEKEAKTTSQTTTDREMEENTIAVPVIVEVAEITGTLVITTKPATAFLLSESLNLWLGIYPLNQTTESFKPSFILGVKAIDLEEHHYLLAVTDNHHLETTTEIGACLAPFLPHESKKIFSLLEAIYGNYPQMATSSQIINLYRQISPNLISSQLQIDRGYWLTPSIFYLEASVEEVWLAGEVKIFAFSDDNWAIGTARAFQITDHTLAIIAIFDAEIYTSSHAAYSLVVSTDTKILKIEGKIGDRAYSLEFIKIFNQKPEYQKHLIRETITGTIVRRPNRNCADDRAKLIQKLQYFSLIEQFYPNNSELPFQIFFERIIPIKIDGLFLSGWLQDPYDLLESIEVISDLGISLSIDKQNIHKFDRQDVSEYLKSTPYGNFEDKHGFCTHLFLPEVVREQLRGLAELHSFRFRIHLKGRIYLEYIPTSQHQDIHSARQTILQIAPPEKIDPAMLLDCIAPAAAKLHQYCIEAAAIREVTTFGNPITEPLISIIIPLYKCLEFLKVQFATMANDPSLRDNCELIYVLDSPEQEKEVKDFLQHHCLLYQLPATLAIMELNSGYAAANNYGVTQARGKYLILMNSDVFPKQAGWAMKMAEFYAANPKIGTLAPKLLYEDDSLQHAGMYFTKTTFPFWLTLHYYKGFPHSYAPACVNREVPAVTGACLFVAKELFDRVNGITTDYIIGDFEDSDFCFKCASLGYQSWYFADTELYHLERQSVPLNNVYAHSLAWQYNARLHDDRWKSVISQQ